MTSCDAKYTKPVLSRCPYCQKFADLLDNNAYLDNISCRCYPKFISDEDYATFLDNIGAVSGPISSYIVASAIEGEVFRDKYELSLSIVTMLYKFYDHILLHEGPYYIARILSVLYLERPLHYFKFLECTPYIGSHVLRLIFRYILFGEEIETRNLVGLSNVLDPDYVKFSPCSDVYSAVVPASSGSNYVLEALVSLLFSKDDTTSSLYEVCDKFVEEYYESRYRLGSSPYEVGNYIGSILAFIRIAEFFESLGKPVDASAFYGFYTDGTATKPGLFSSRFMLNIRSRYYCVGCSVGRMSTFLGINYEEELPICSRSNSYIG